MSGAREASERPSRLFGAKLIAARAIGGVSRRSGRGGGTTLPGRLLLRTAPDAIRRLGSRIDGDRTVISATNGKTTTAGMLAAILRAAGRDPVHNRAGSNMAWGVATALLEQQGDEGLFEVDEAWLPQVAAELDPTLLVLGNLFRDQLDRYGELEHLADEWAELIAAREGKTGLVLNADDPLIADLGRDRDLRRRRDTTFFGIEDESQALPELQHAFDAKHCRRCGAPYRYERAFVGHLGHYSCPNCQADRPAPDVYATEIELRGIEGSAFTVHSGDAELAIELPLPGLYNVYNALAAIASAERLGVDSERIQAGLGSVKAAFGRVETIAVGDGAALHPPDQEPRRGERGPANAAARGRAGAATSLNVWLALNDGIADGRDVSWIWDADFELLSDSVDRITCAGTRAAEIALRLKYAGWPADQDRRDRRHRRVARPGALDGRRAALRTAHLHGADRAAHAARPPRPSRGVLAMSVAAPPVPVAVTWHDAECGGYAGDLPLWRELAEASGGPVLDLGAGSGRVALDLAERGCEVVAVDSERQLLDALGARAAERGLAIETVTADVRELALGRAFPLVLAPMQLLHMLGGAANRSRALAAIRAHLAARRDLRRRDPRRAAAAIGAARSRCPTSARSAAGSTRACRSRFACRSARSRSSACASSSRRTAS